MHAGGNTYDGYATQHIPMDTHLAKVQTKHSMFAAKYAHQHEGTEHRRHQSGYGNSLHTHVQTDDKEQVEQHIHHPAGCHHEERTTGIAFASQDSCGEVHQHEEGHSQEIDSEIEHSQRHDALWCMKPREDILCTQPSNDGQQHSAQQRYSDGGVYGS